VLVIDGEQCHVYVLYVTWSWVEEGGLSREVSVRVYVVSICESIL
jgi:hypothetical protein